jgi:16S rRNA (cytidine1402-2'-O)-methyltransferase
MTGRVVLAGAPLGNPGDATARLREALGTAEVIAAEDTRRLRRLAADLGVEITGRIVSYFEGNEVGRTQELRSLLADGVTVLVVTDAGMPSVSDPGYRLVAAAVADGVPVTSLPGPSAVTTALAVSGLPSDRFCFEGFPPRTRGARTAMLRSLARERRTMVFFESPRRIGAFLADAVGVLGGERPAAVCRELTKTHEEIRRGPLAELAAWAADGLLGEVTVVVGGDTAPPEPPSAADLVRRVAAEEAAGLSRKDAMRAVADETGVSRSVVFDALVAAKEPND